MAFEMVMAAPVLINTPDSTPAVKMRNTAEETPFTPSVIEATTSSSERPPAKPPIKAPRMRLYAGDTFLIINPIATNRPNNAPTVLSMVYDLKGPHYL